MLGCNYVDLFYVKHPSRKRKVFDVKDANLRSYAGITIQLFPENGLDTETATPFFKSDLEIGLIFVDGEPRIEIRRKRWTIK